ncbi:hypothetical protein GCM10010964_05620 [Caldovatus sediminis]|uniref:HIRAN domain-containing protein n=1 Tax=Caldovatus sediminis TaxID=2041189 RepID=A0A8J3EC95_9PROT|nr:hypothetical protein [Caldovatus sediminis]GGG20257.1 hypothetical protein GCM10010964_05620 [Caldovatus sediminis]
MPHSRSPDIEEPPRPHRPAILRPDDAREAHRPDPDRPVAVAELDSFVAGLAASAAPRAVAALRAGAELRLRRRGHADFRPGEGAIAPEIEVWTAEGQPLGRLPPEDAAALDRLALPGQPVRARVSAVVPAFLRPRVQLRIAFAHAPDDAAPAPR